MMPRTGAAVPWGPAGRRTPAVWLNECRAKRSCKGPGLTHGLTKLYYIRGVSLCWYNGSFAKGFLVVPSATGVGAGRPELMKKWLGAVRRGTRELYEVSQVLRWTVKSNSDGCFKTGSRAPLFFMHTPKTAGNEHAAIFE